MLDPPVLTAARSASARTSPATRGQTAAGRSCPTPGSRTSRAPSIAAAVRLAAAGRSSGSCSPYPASLAAKLDAFAMLTAVTALFVQNESGGGPGTRRNATYLAHALQTGQHPRLAELLAADPAGDNAPGGAAPGGGAPDRYPGIMARVLTGLLAPT